MLIGVREIIFLWGRDEKSRSSFCPDMHEIDRQAIATPVFSWYDCRCDYSVFGGNVG